MRIKDYLCRKKYYIIPLKLNLINFIKKETPQLPRLIKIHRLSLKGEISLKEEKKASHTVESINV